VTVATHEALAKMRAIVQACQEDPLAWISWLPVQASFLADPAAIKLLRAGNQVGKTWAGLAEVHYQALGRHPLRPIAPRPEGARFEAWVVCSSWAQSLAIQEKLWHIARRYLVDDCKYDPINGFHANKPAARYKNGAIVRFKTGNQDSLDLAGATINLVLFDEPPLPFGEAGNGPDVDAGIEGIEDPLDGPGLPSPVDANVTLRGQAHTLSLRDPLSVHRPPVGEA